MGTTTITPNISIEANLPEAIWARFVAPFLEGSENVVRAIEIDDVDDLSFLRCTSVDAVERVMSNIRATLPARETATTVPFDFWQIGHAPFTNTRHLDVPALADIVHHYPGEVGDQLVSLAENPPASDEGRIILWHGPPGTGKTTAIRALAGAWRDTHRFQVVLDPDAAFSSSAQLMRILTADLDEAAPGLWRVLVIEDADELIRDDAKDRVGQALSRLLNLGDGILGQGMKVLALITTNERVRRLHPALMRPGRCVAEINYRKFTRQEAAAAFGDGAVIDGRDLSLAEIMNPDEPTKPTPIPGGMYI